MGKNSTIDDFLGGKIKIIQPEVGYRAGLDAVALAAAVAAQQGHKILDVGCGVGTSFLCAAYHNPEAFFTGLETQQDLVILAQRNILLNEKLRTCQVLQGSIAASSLIMPHSFDGVMTNPPYFTEKTSTPSPTVSKAMAHIESLSLKDWLSFCIKALKPRGILTLIYPTDRLHEVLASLVGKIGDIHLYPLWPKVETPSKRFILRGRKQLKTGVTLNSGLVVHNTDGTFTSETKAILEGNQTIKL